MNAAARAAKAKRYNIVATPLFRVLALTIASFAAASCASTPPPIAALPVAPQQAPATETSLKAILMSGAQPDVLAFYQAREFRPVWTGGDDRMIAGVRTALGNATQQGLRNSDYMLPRDTRPAEGTDAARYEVAVTSVVLRYARDVRMGRFRAGDIYGDADLPAPVYNSVADLDRAVASDSLARYLTELPPAHPEYRRLAAALARYRTIAEEGGWEMLPGATEIRLDRNDARLAALTERLTFEDPVLDANPKPSSNDIRDAVKRFQARNGLVDDGRAGPETIATLNVPAPVRVEQIAANMERWRWLPQQFESRYVMVNVPDQSVQYIREGKIVLKSKVIVGRKTSATPIIRTEIKTVVVNPPWNIPGDIAARDLLPRLKRNANYLATRKMVVMDGPPGDPTGRTIKWRNIKPEEFPYAIRQLPGPTTALGAVMLDSPNDFDVYLHDTPNKKLYDSNMREISNGCVRVQDIFPLASLALTGDMEDGMGTINAARKTGQTQRIALDNPVPVYFLYWTASADADGNVDFRPDRYGRDTALIAAFARGSAVPTKALLDTDPGEELNPIGGMQAQPDLDADDLAP